VSELAPDRRRIVANNYVRYENVTKTDAQVLQCNASNKHGYVFSNAYLNVLGQYVCCLQSSFHLFLQHVSRQLSKLCKLWNNYRQDVTLSVCL